jgi:hypothetical protein
MIGINLKIPQNNFSPEPKTSVTIDCSNWQILIEHQHLNLPQILNHPHGNRSND